MRPEPTGVWLVREGDPTSIEGRISLDDQGLLFDPADASADALTIPFTRIARVRRRRGTPLLEIALKTTDQLSSLFFYFAKPPPLSEERSASAGPFIKGPRGLERSAAAMTLRAANRLLKRDIDGWVRAVRTAATGA